MAGVAFDHLVGGLEASIGDFGNGELLVVSLLSRDDRGVGHQWEMNTGVGDLQKNLKIGRYFAEKNIFEYKIKNKFVLK